MKRRKFISISAAAGLSGLAGCTYNLDNERFSLESSPVGVPDFLLDQTIVTDYEITDIGKSKMINYKEDKRDVHFTQWKTQLFTDNNDLTQAWFFTHPNRELADLNVKPLIIDDAQDMADMINPRWEDYRIGSVINMYDVRTLGSKINVREYDGFMQSEEVGEIDATYLFFKTESSNDKVVFLAGLPKDKENKNDMISIIQAAIHPFEPYRDSDDQVDEYS